MASETGQDYARHKLYETKQILRDGIWDMQRLGIFDRRSSAQLLLLLMVEHISSRDCAPLDHAKWDELKWRPRVDLSKIRGDRQANPATLLAEMTGRHYQAVAKDLQHLWDMGIVTFDKGFANLRIVLRDQDDVAVAEPVHQPQIKRTVMVRMSEVEYTG